MLSTTVTVNEHMLVRPLASVARWRTCVVPIGKSEPEAGPVIRVTSTVPVQLSVATSAG